MTNSKLILLYGFAGVGKTTISERYIDDNPLSVNLEADKIVTMVGRWADHEPEAWDLVYDMSKAMIATCVERGRDVVVPHMPRSAEQLAGYESLAHEIGARFVEVCLTGGRDTDIERLIQRGNWGEEGAPPITEADRPVINELYDGMETALATRPNVIGIPTIENDYDGTYQRFLEAVEQA